jgi:hypothetical protein
VDRVAATRVGGRRPACLLGALPGSPAEGHHVSVQTIRHEGGFSTWRQVWAFGPSDWPTLNIPAEVLEDFDQPRVWFEFSEHTLDGVDVFARSAAPLAQGTLLPLVRSEPGWGAIGELLLPQPTQPTTVVLRHVISWCGGIFIEGVTDAGTVPLGSAPANELWSIIRLGDAGLPVDRIRLGCADGGSFFLEQVSVF